MDGGFEREKMGFGLWNDEGILEEIEEYCNL